jgi:hypothetical protein
MDNEIRDDHAHPETADASVRQAAADIGEQAEAQKSRVADGADHAADAARRTAQNLRGDETWMADLIEQGAGKLTDMAQTLRESDLNTLLLRTQQFARNQPVMFTGAAVALGFALTRVIGAAARGNAR